MDEDAALMEEQSKAWVESADLPEFGFDTVDMYREMFNYVAPEGTPTGFEEWTEQVTRSYINLSWDDDKGRTIMHVPDNKLYDGD